MGVYDVYIYIYNHISFLLSEKEERQSEISGHSLELKVSEL